MKLDWFCAVRLWVFPGDSWLERVLNRVLDGRHDARRDLEELLNDHLRLDASRYIDTVGRERFRYI